MGIATFKTVAAGDGSPQSPPGYCFYLVIHAVATVLLLIAVVAAIWQFMDWVVAPSCSKDVALATAPVAASHPRSAHAEAALDDADCPCPHERRPEKSQPTRGGCRNALRDSGVSA
jgi:hypothetical protein